MECYINYIILIVLHCTTKSYILILYGNKLNIDFVMHRLGSSELFMQTAIKINV